MKNVQATGEVFIPQNCRVSDPDPDPYWIRIRNLNTDPDPDPGGQKLPKKVEKIHVLKCWMASFVSWRLLL
jgi:hypothetical protein